MGRAALGWTVKRLSEAARVGTATINRFELAQAEPIPATVMAIERCLEAAGVEFQTGGWVRLKPQLIGNDA